MLTLQQLASRIAMEKNSAIPSGILKRAEQQVDYKAIMTTTAFEGFKTIEGSYNFNLVTTTNLHEIILDPKVKGMIALIYGQKSPFFCDNWSHSIITNDVLIVANCAKNKGYIIYTDFKSGFLSFMSGYVACIF
jgi:hypothetical protein